MPMSWIRIYPGLYNAAWVTIEKLWLPNANGEYTTQRWCIWRVKDGVEQILGNEGGYKTLKEAKQVAEQIPHGRDD